MKKIIVLILSVSLLSVAYADVAYKDAAYKEDKALNNLVAKLAKLDVLYANFSQVISDEKGKKLQNSEGEFWFQKPNKVYWNTQVPYQHLVVTDGKLLWLYDIDLEQATKRKANKAIEQTPALILAGDRELIKRDYKVTELKKLKDSTFTLIPYNKNAMFAQMQLVFKNQQLAQLFFKDKFDQQTVVDFSNIKTNVQPASNQFQFIAPKSVDVIEDNG